ncbi:hypothetical protein SRB5_44980 [Streptomyces sp. RB5]|uniref:Alpha-tubulin suppressor-like RCC1 family protein n=1 Tax=Streptomyces smaragdinus TaxID=2585196 RepID=A0A7K0CNJ7_9ACTN|nr:SpaA isopeptide-forming pilin-related protein [Streptomyces smaragdinus]MQY14334.1 hypothetical protein [Streptomyces smaragdinus]
MRVLNFVRPARTHHRRPAVLLALLWALVAGLGLTAPAAAAQEAESALSTGYNVWGQLGDGTVNNRNTPGDIVLPDGVRLTAIEAGTYFGLGLTSEGKVLAWGQNNAGQLGDGTMTDHRTPMPVDLPADATIVAIAAGSMHGLALASDGRLFAWGNNDRGQLGDGSVINRLTPVEVDLPPGTTVTQLAAGLSHTLALTSVGEVLAWGGNDRGQLGDGTVTEHHVPTPVDLASGITVTEIAAGDIHSLAVTSEGEALAWGYNAGGQLGDGSATDRRVPTPVHLPSGTVVTGIAGGSSHSLAVTSTGDVLTWGYNLYGQLGDDSTANQFLPVQALLPPGVTATAVGAGMFHSLARTSDGRLLAWGENFYGGLGDGTYVQSGVPVWVDLPAGQSVIDFDGGLSFSLIITGPPADGEVLITKTDRKTGDPLAGAVFRLWRESNGRPGLQTRGDSPDTAVGDGCATDAEGRCSFENLPSGDYYVQETDVPEGYKLPKHRVTGPFEVNGAGGGVELHLTNERVHCPKGKPC